MTVVNVTPPSISGTAKQGQILTTSNGTWTFDLDYLTYAYQWLRCDAAGANCVDIANATSQTYLIQAADVGSRLRSEVTATEHTTPVGPGWPTNYYAGPAGQNIILPDQNPGVLCGIWDSGGVGINKITAREAEIGRKFDIGCASYGSGNTANYDNKISLIMANGNIPMVSFHFAQTIAQVNSGNADAWITASAQELASLDVPMFVRLFHEFGGTWMPYYTSGTTAQSAQPFINAWRRVVGIFQAEGVTKCSFCWHTGGDVANCKVRYPGDDWVDWVASSHYAFGDPVWIGFVQGYPDLWKTVDWAREFRYSQPSTYSNPSYQPYHDVYDKPYMYGEMGHYENSRKGPWITSIKPTILGTYNTASNGQNGAFDKVHALLYSDYGTETDPNGQNWTLDAPASGLTAFATLLQDPIFNTQNL